MRSGASLSPLLLLDGLTGATGVDGLRLRRRIVYFLEEGKPVDAAPFLRMIRNDTGYMQYAASRLLAIFMTYVAL